MIGLRLESKHRVNLGVYRNALIRQARLLGKHSGLNYLFELNNRGGPTSKKHSGEVLDSATYGNETRYLNDGPNPNCSARSMICHVSLCPD